MTLEAQIRAKETGDDRWLDADFWRRNNGPFCSRKLRAERKAGAEAAAHKLWAADPYFRYLRRMLGNARKNAARREHECSLTDAALWALLEESGRACQVTGVPFDLTPHRNGRSPFAPSLDRIDGRRGYVAGNVRIVVQIANLAMNVWDADTLRAFIARAR